MMDVQHVLRWNLHFATHTHTHRWGREVCCEDLIDMLVGVLLMMMTLVLDWGRIYILGDYDVLQWQLSLCYGQWWLPVENPPVEGPRSPSLSPSLPPSLRLSSSLWCFWYSLRAVCSFCKFTLVYYGSDGRAEMTSASCTPPRSSVSLSVCLCGSVHVRVHVHGAEVAAHAQ